MDEDQFAAVVDAIVKELVKSGLAKVPGEPQGPAGTALATGQKQAPAAGTGSQLSPSTTGAAGELKIDLDDPTTPEMRSLPGIDRPQDAEGLQALMASTPARIGTGRAGTRFRTRPWLLFLADQAITQDTLLRDVDEALLKEMGLFSVQTCITGGKAEYLLRPDLGRQLNDEARRTVHEKCVQAPRIQVCVGDGLSAMAIEANLRQILPVIQSGCQNAGLSMGTPFFIKYCRVGVMNDVGDLVHPDVLMLLIGERPGLGRAESMSIYMGYRPQAGHTDAERDVICNIFDNGGTNPLEAGAYAVQMAQKMIQTQASGVRLKLAEKG